jgi:hypothetical protein
LATSARVFAAQWFARTALLLLWSLVAWGALLLLLTLVDALGEGFGPALARLLPAHGAPLWAWLNALSAVLAAAVGAAAAGYLVLTRRGSAPRPPRAS